MNILGIGFALAAGVFFGIIGPIIPKNTPAVKANIMPKIFILYQFFFD